MASVSLIDVGKSYGKVEVLRGINLDIEDGEFCVFVGPSGCGKSTLLRMIAGLEPISAGVLRIGEQVANDLPPAARGLAMVFQSYALYPHMTVAENMGFSLTVAKAPKSEIRKRVLLAAEILQLESLLERKPKTLSGGQRQRVAIGRAIVRNPKVFLFDEPLSNLDAELRVKMRAELAQLHEQLGTTMIYVTHDQVEAMTLADKIVVLEGGRIQQIGSPLTLYQNPANKFVAGFIGAPKMNFMTATVRSPAQPSALSANSSVVVTGGAALNIPQNWGIADCSEIWVGIRPEHLQLTEDGQIAGEVSLIERLGCETYIHVMIHVEHIATCDARRAAEQIVIVRVAGNASITLHQKVRIAIDPMHCHFFGADGVALPACS